MRVLLTGGAGFIGYHLAVALQAQGARVDLVDNMARGRLDRDLEALLAKDGVQLIERDLREPLDDLGTGYDHVIHFAALLGVENVRKRPYEVLTLNHRLLENVVEFARKQSDLSRLLFTSTSEIYAGTLRYHDMPVPTPEDTPLTVNDLFEARTSYMLSKIYGEAVCIHSGVPFTVVRPHNVYGPRMGLSHVVPQLLQRAYELPQGEVFDVYSVDHRRTFCYVEDAVNQMLRILSREACANTQINVGTEAPEVPIGELARLVLKTVDKDARLNPLPATPGSPERRAPSMAKSVELLDYRSQVSLEEGLRRSFDWYRERVFDGNELTAV